MEFKDYSASHREVLFDTLSQEQQGDDNWDNVFSLLRRGQQAAERADLEELAEQFAAGQEVVADELKKGGQFLDWELQFMRLGMATGQLGAIYERLARHYRLITQLQFSFRRHLYVPMTLLVLCALGLPLMGWQQGQYSLSSADTKMFMALLPVLIGLVLSGLALLLYRSGRLPGQVLRLAYALPGIGNSLERYQTYHFLSNLTLCTEAGFSLGQALKQAARRVPYSPATPKFLRLQAEVQNGGRLSAALMNSGIIKGVEVPELAAGTSVQGAQQALTQAVYRDCLVQMEFWSRTLPWLLLGLLPYVAVISVWSG